MLGLIFIAPVLFSLQSVALKQYGLKCDNTESGKSIFSLLYFAISAVCAMVIMLMFGDVSSPISMVYGAFYGLFFFGFINLYETSMKLAPLSITAFIFSISMIIPIILSMIIYNESLKFTHVLGFVLVLVALYFINFGNQHGKKMVLSKKWVILCLIGSISNGLLLFTTKAFAIGVPDGNLGQFLMSGYLVCVLLTLPRFLLPKARESINSYKFSKWVIPLAIIIAVGNTVGNGLLSYLGLTIDASILFPVTNSFSVMVTIVISRFAFQEKLLKHTLYGLAIGLLAIVVLSI